MPMIGYRNSKNISHSKSCAVWYEGRWGLHWSRSVGLTSAWLLYSLVYLSQSQSQWISPLTPARENPEEVPRVRTSALEKGQVITLSIIPPLTLGSMHEIQLLLWLGVRYE
jgi:hypothetical protein